MQRGNRLTLVSQVSIEVDLPEEMRNTRSDIRGWLSVEDKLLPGGVRVHIQLYHNNASELWCASYNIAKRCRESNMESKAMKACIEDLSNVADCAALLDY